MEEADGLVYCKFQNISTARLAGAIASLGQTEERRDPWGLWATGPVVQRQAERGGEERGKKVGKSV